MSEPSRSTHPAIIVAAVAVTIASLTAVASLSGLLPGKSAPETALIAASSEPVPAPPPAPEATLPPAPPPPHTVPPKTQRFDPPPPPKINKSSQAVHPSPQPTGNLRYASERTTSVDQGQGNDAGIDVVPARPANPPPPVCHECGTVEAVREVSAPAEASGLGAIAGGVVGGLLGHQVGRGSGNTAATIVGAVGGAFAGNQTEKYVRAEKQLQITVRFEDGNTRTVAQEGGSRWQVGDHVRLNNGKLLPN